MFSELYFRLDIAVPKQPTLRGQHFLRNFFFPCYLDHFQPMMKVGNAKMENIQTEFGDIFGTHSV